MNNYDNSIVLNLQTGNNNTIFIYYTQIPNKIIEITDNFLIYSRNYMTYIVLLYNITKLYQLNLLFKNFLLGQYIESNIVFLQTLFFLIKSR